MDTKKIDAELATLIEEAFLKTTTEKRKKVIKRRVSYLRQCRRYITTNPREGFVKEEIERILKEISILDGRYSQWFQSHSNVNNPLRVYGTEMGIPKLKKSLALLRFISKQ